MAFEHGQTLRACPWHPKPSFHFKGNLSRSPVVEFDLDIGTTAARQLRASFEGKASTTGVVFDVQFYRYAEPPGWVTISSNTAFEVGGAAVEGEYNLPTPVFNPTTTNPYVTATNPTAKYRLVFKRPTSFSVSLDWLDLGVKI